MIDLSLLFYAVAPTVLGLAGTWLRLHYLKKRDELEAKRYKMASMHVSDAYYRGGKEDMEAMGKVQEMLLQATAPEERKGLLEQLRRPQPPLAQPPPAELTPAPQQRPL